MTLTVLMAAQVATFAALGGYFLTTGAWRLGVAQLLLAVVQVVIYG